MLLHVYHADHSLVSVSAVQMLYELALHFNDQI